MNAETRNRWVSAARLSTSSNGNTCDQSGNPPLDLTRSASAVDSSSSISQALVSPRARLSLASTSMFSVLHAATATDAFRNVESAVPPPSESNDRPRMVPSALRATNVHNSESTPCTSNPHRKGNPSRIAERAHSAPALPVPNPQSIARSPDHSSDSRSRPGKQRLLQLRSTSEGNAPAMPAHPDSNGITSIAMAKGSRSLLLMRKASMITLSRESAT